MYNKKAVKYYEEGRLLHQKGKLSGAERAYKKATKINSDFFEAYNNLGNVLLDRGRLKEAADAYRKALKLLPSHPMLLNNLGNALQLQGENERAVNWLNNAIANDPNYADAYSNLGNALTDLGKFQESVQAYNKAIQLKPDLAEAYSNRGNALKDLGQLEEAVASYNKAIQLKPDFAEAYCNRGFALEEQGDLDAAIVSYQKAVSIDPQNGLFWTGFADVLQAVRLTSYSDDLGHYLLQILEQPTVRPRDISKAVISALHYHPAVSHTLELSKSDHIDEDIDHLTIQLSTVPLLLRVMELSPIADLDIENMFTQMRKAMLHKAVSGDGEVQGFPFYMALAMHCFTNEYIFSESEEEKQEIEFLQKEVKITLEKGCTVPPAWIAILGAYRTLYSFSWAEDLVGPDWSGDIKKVITEQVNNIREEKALRSKIPRLTSIEDKISQLVRNQYEENPYPRWVNAGLSYKPKTIRQVLQSIKLHLKFDAQQFSNKPDILIAGCGTGQQALGTASRFLNCNVLAMDLSLSSLSYAIRKTQELGVTNIEYMQGDILKLNQLERKFDIIESAGVLHHMDAPLAGWKVLVDRLRTGGLMKIGLYSDIARQHIVEARRQIAKKKYTASPDDIRRYRDEIINTDLNSDSEIAKVIESRDFYSLSTCRDLLFHAQEHRFTLPQIELALNELGLNFLGFELKQSWIKSRFSELYPEKDAAVSLSLWHQFELKNPNTFRGMYQFWVQKI